MATGDIVPQLNPVKTPQTSDKFSGPGVWVLLLEWSLASSTSIVWQVGRISGAGAAAL